VRLQEILGSSTPRMSQQSRRFAGFCDRGVTTGDSSNGYGSARRVDLAVAAIMAHSRAVELARRPAPTIYVG
jgi:hypothetical protein